MGVPARLTSTEVAKVFTDHVPGVQKLLFRQQRGQCVLKFLQVAYKDGWSAFRATPLDNHLKWLMRLIVHYGHEGNSGASKHLREVAEAFMDCQAVQARVVERIGLQIQGLTTDFRGLVVALLGEYKTMALKMLAAERIAQGKAFDDATPTHYENRLTADLGEQLGLNADDVRRAALDEHAWVRFAKLRSSEVDTAAKRCRELFDLDAFLQVLVSELNSFSESSSPSSLPRQFLDWVSENMTEKHEVFDEETCSRVDADRTLVMAVLEVVFLGQLDGMANAAHRGSPLQDVFGKQQVEQPAESPISQSACNEVSACEDVDEHIVLVKGSSDVQKCVEDAAGLNALIEMLFSPAGLMCVFGSWFAALWPLKNSLITPVSA